jgi:hypothetical protein
MVSVTRHHDDKIVRERDKPPDSEAILSASVPLVTGSHLLMPLLVEMFIQF